MVLLSFELARKEVLHLVSKPIMVAAFAVMLVIPLLYGALYLRAFWDPYGSLDRLPVAVVNLDHPSRTEATTLTAGADLVAGLLDTRTFDWHVVSPDEAARGVQAGTYYSSLTIPADFSATLAHADSDTPARATLKVTLHESKNMIASQIESKVYSEVRKAASASASKRYFDTVFLGFDEVRERLHDAAGGGNALANGLADAEDGSNRLVSGAGEARDGGERLAAGLGKLKSGASAIASGTGQAAAGSMALATGAEGLSRGTGSLAKGAGRVSTGAGALAGGLSALEGGTSSLSASAKTLAAGAAQVDLGVAHANAEMSQASEGAADIAEGGEGLTELLAALAAKYPDAAADPLFKRASATASAVSSGSATLADSLGAATGSAKALADGAHSVALGAQQLSTGAAKVATATAQASTGAHALADGAGEVSSGSASLAAGARRLDAGADDAASGIGRLADGSALLARNVAKADAGAAELAAGLHRLNNGTVELSDGIENAASGSRELANGLTAGVKDVPHYTESGRTARAGMMSDPVALDETKLGSVKTYGTGFAPYFVPLSLWVGMLIVFVLLSPIPERAARSGAKAPIIAMAGMWPAMFIGLGQSVLMYVVLHFGLGLDPIDPLATFGLIVLTSVVFAAVMQLLGAAFGPVGKIMGIVILMLQLTSAAGTFPLETLPTFFRTISPWLPMTHAVSALRESISGGDVATMLREALVLAAFGAAAFAGTVSCARTAHHWDPKRLRPTVEL